MPCSSSVFMAISSLTGAVGVKMTSTLGRHGAGASSEGRVAGGTHRRGDVILLMDAGRHASYLEG